MSRSGPVVATLAVAVPLILGAVAVGGCGFGPGQASPGEADLRVTREFGAIAMVEATLTDPTPSDTVVRFLDRNADVETSYGGNFVDSIDGFAGSTAGGGAEDWFFFVNGYYSDVGAGETRVLPGDRIWWDHRYWSAAYRVPAVIGSWPEPFLHGYDGKTYETVVECLTDPSDCAAVASALESVGVEPRVERMNEPVANPDALRVLVGPWAALRADPAARQIEAGPQTSGVYGRMVSCDGGWQLEIDDARGEPARRLADAGLVAAVRDGEDQPTWVITGTDADSVGEATELLDASALGERYAVATAGGEELALPTGEAEDVPVEPADCG